jgi:hypothetical protein
MNLFTATPAIKSCRYRSVAFWGVRFRFARSVFDIDQFRWYTAKEGVIRYRACGERQKQIT